MTTRKIPLSLWERVRVRGVQTINAAEKMLEVKGVSFEYPGERQPTAAIKEVNLAVGEGEYVALIGPNGSGKTTLLKLFNALLLPTAGEVLVGGLSTSRQENLPSIRRACGMIFPNPDNHLVATTVEEDIAFGLENAAIPPEEIRAKVDEVLALLELRELASYPPHLLSGGQKQRVAIAGLLAMSPRCLLMDEPTAMLDPAGRREVLHTVHTLNREMKVTVIHVTHDPEEAALAGRVLLLDRGILIKDGTPASVQSDLSLLHRLGLRGTMAAELAALLRQDGLALPRELLHGRELVDFLCESSWKR